MTSLNRNEKIVIVTGVFFLVVFGILSLINGGVHYVASTPDGKYNVLYTIEQKGLAFNQNDERLTKIGIYPCFAIYELHGNGYKSIATAPTFTVVVNGKPQKCYYVGYYGYGDDCLFTVKRINNVSFIYNGVTFEGMMPYEKGNGLWLAGTAFGMLMLLVGLCSAMCSKKRGGGLN